MSFNITNLAAIILTSDFHILISTLQQFLFVKKMTTAIIALIITISLSQSNHPYHSYRHVQNKGIDYSSKISFPSSKFSSPLPPTISILIISSIRSHNNSNNNIYNNKTVKQIVSIALPQREIIESDIKTPRTNGRLTCNQVMSAAFKAFYFIGNTITTTRELKPNVLSFFFNSCHLNPWQSAFEPNLIIYGICQVRN